MVDDDDDDFHVPGLPRRRRRRRRDSDADENVLISPQVAFRASPALVPAREMPSEEDRAREPDSDPLPSVPRVVRSDPPPATDAADADDDADFAIAGLRTRKREPSARSGTPRVVVTAAVTSLLVIIAVFAGLRVAPRGVARWLGIDALRGTASHAGDTARADSSRGAGPSATHAAPDFVRMPLANARSVADVLGVRLNVRERRSDGYIAAESVTFQSVPAGSPMRRGDVVDVVVSAGSGAAAAAMPAAMPTADASSAPATAPTANANVANAPGANVSSATASLVAVPRLTGLRFGRVRGILEQAGLRLGSHRETFDSDRGPYVILWQSRQPGAQVARGSSIDVVVNQGE